jgi:hypothetical protein
MNTDYWEAKNRQPSYNDWLVEWHGSILCACDHGCNQWLAENACKAHEIMLALQKGATELELDVIVQKHVSEVFGEIHQRMWDEMKAKRKSSDETQS